MPDVELKSLPADAESARVSYRTLVETPVPRLSVTAKRAVPPSPTDAFPTRTCGRS